MRSAHVLTAMRSLGAKTMIAVGAIAVPALAVAVILGITLINTVRDVEADSMSRCRPRGGFPKSG